MFLHIYTIHLLISLCTSDLLMIDQKVAIVTIHDVAPPYLEKTLQVSDELNKLKINYNLGIVPYYEKQYNIKDHAAFCDQISSLLQ